MAAIFGRCKKVNNQVVASRTGETDVGLGAAGDASHSVEPLPGIACRGTALSEPWGSNTILNNISNPAAQPENCVVLSAETNAFTQKHPPVLGRNSLSASGAGKCLGPPLAKVPSRFERGFVQDLRPSKVLSQRRADCHVSEPVRDVNDVVVSRLPQRGDVRERVFNRYPPPKKNYQTLEELHDGYQNELARNDSNGRNIGFLPLSGNSSAEQQNCFFEYPNSKIFMDKAALIGYNSANMPFIFFKNRINAFVDSCPFEGARLTLLQADCAETAAKTIATLTSDTPGLSEKDRIEMSLERLSQRFGVRGEFLSEPEIRKYPYGNKLVFSSANIMKKFKDQLDQCLLCARAYNQREKLEDSFVLDLAKRLPFEAKQRYLECLLDKYVSTSELTYQSLVDFVKREQLCKSTDFGIMLLGESQKRQENKKFDKSKATCRVRQTTAKSNESHPLIKSSDSAPVYRAGDSRSPRGGGARNAPLCIYCSFSGKDEYYWLSSCRHFLQLNSKDRRDVVMKSGKCLNCLRNHFVKDCTFGNNCRRCGNACDKKHFFLLHDYFVDSGHKPPQTSAEPKSKI